MNDKIYTVEEIRAIVQPILEKHHIGRAYLFGSYARGEQTAESDIDVMVLADVSREELSSYKKPFVLLASELGLCYDIVVTVTLKDTETFNKYSEVVPFYANVKKEGIKIAV